MWNISFIIKEAGLLVCQVTISEKFLFAFQKEGKYQTGIVAQLAEIILAIDITNWRLLGWINLMTAIFNFSPQPQTSNRNHKHSLAQTAPNFYQPKTLSSDILSRTTMKTCPFSVIVVSDSSVNQALFTIKQTTPIDVSCAHSVTSNSNTNTIWRGICEVFMDRSSVHHVTSIFIVNHSCTSMNSTYLLVVMQRNMLPCNSRFSEDWQMIQVDKVISPSPSRFFSSVLFLMLWLLSNSNQK